MGQEPSTWPTAGFFQALVEHSPMLIAVLDPDGGRHYANPAALAQFARAEPVDLGSVIVDAAHPDDLPTARTAAVQATAGTLAVPAEFRLRAPDGTWRTVSMTSRDLRDDPAVRGIVVYAVDTGPARAVAAQRLLAELSALKTEFVAVLSHELRTPLTSIATFAGMLDGDDPDPGEYQAAIGAIRRNTDRMLSLVADLVLLARLESGDLRPASEPVDLAPLVAAVPPGGPPVTGDQGLLRQLFDTVAGVVAGISADVTVAATVEQGHWRIRTHAHTTEPVTPERLLATRLPHPGHPGDYRSGSLALTLARAIAARHGGELSTVLGPDTVTATVSLPAATA